MAPTVVVVVVVVVESSTTRRRHLCAASKHRGPTSLFVFGVKGDSYHCRGNMTGNTGLVIIYSSLVNMIVMDLKMKSQSGG